MPSITLTSEHKYLDATGREYLGTTSIIKASGLMSENGSQWHMDKGTIIHDMLYLYEKDDLASYDPQLDGYLRSWMKFKEVVNWKTEGMETPLVHPQYFYGGKPDIWGHMNGEPQLTLLDWKSGAKSSWHVLQGASYKELLKVNGVAIRKDAALYLSEEGKMGKLGDPSTRENLNDFLTLLGALRVKEKYL
jgi:hypothetical protein